MLCFDEVIPSETGASVFFLLFLSSAGARCLFSGRALPCISASSPLVFVTRTASSFFPTQLGANPSSGVPLRAVLQSLRARATPPRWLPCCCAAAG